MLLRRHGYSQLRSLWRNSIGDNRDYLSDAFLRSFRKVLVRACIVFTGSREPEALASNPVKVSLLVTSIPFSCFRKKNSWNANNPFFLADQTTRSYGMTSSTLILTSIGNKKGRKEHLRSFPFVRHFSSELTSFITVFQAVQHVRSVKVLQTISMVEWIITDSFMIMKSRPSNPFFP